ncbi:POTRA domain-containing protein [uncultured Formosa sp.]|uniref:POTRA domain-containing protein n=1 Tax=uncultured Formosa sp. TaxID=255435 RepID=UPI0026375638|nr:POTRA domain-containing protein [uncultured Formosa sp.]
MLQKFLFITLFFLISPKVLCQNLILKIHGETDHETEVIDSITYKNKHTNYRSILNSIDTLSKQLNKIGYIAHSIKDSKKSNDSTIQAFVSLHKKYDHIYIKYLDTDVSPIILQSLNIPSQGNTIILSFNETETELQRLNTKLTENGLPFSSLKLENIIIENDSVKAELKTSKQIKVRHIDNIIIKGYEKFPKKYIKHYVQLKKGSVFNMNNIIKKTNRINKLTFANLIRDPEVLFTRDSTTIYIYVEKQKSNNFDGYIGFATNENTNKLEFSGYLDMLLRNNFNYGETISFLYRSEENEQKTFNLDVDAPYIFKSPIGANVELNIFKKDSSYSTIDQSLNLYYQINTYHKAYLGVSSTQSNNLLENTVISTINEYKSSFYQTRYNFINTTKNSILFPTKTYADFELGFGSRTYNNTKENQILFNTEIHHIFNLNESNSIYTRITAGALQSDTYLENELLRFGGINSIRGFEENSLTANLFGVFNLEYRYQLNPTIYINSITDFSYFENKITLQKENLFSIGVGFALLTKAGLLKLVYANGKTEKQPLNVNNAKIHLSITTSF